MMHRSMFSASLLGTLVLALSPLAVAPDVSAQESEQTETSKIDPAAVDLMRKSANFLANSPALSFNWFVSYDEVIDEKQKLTFMRSGSNVLLRDKGFYSRVEGESGVREYYYDGAQFTVSAPNENFYAAQNFDKGFEALVDAVREATDTEIPLYALMSRDLPERVEGDLESAAYLGITYVAGSEVHHLAFSDAEEDWQVWISTDEASPVPLVIVGTETKKTGWPQYRAYLTDWDLGAKSDQARFSFKPDDDDLKISFPELKSKMATDAKAGGAARATSKAAEPSADGSAPQSEDNRGSEK
jgi:hypothetical protein